MDLSALKAVATRMVAPGKGLLAADESTGTIQKRFDAIAVENTEHNRRDYRELMFRSADAMKAISGVILYDETIFQGAADGTPFVELIEQAGAIPGIKVDEGAKPLPAFPGETITYGLDGLPERLATYRERGARFAKWRAVIDIADGVPTAGAVKANAQALARYANLCQAADIVPIVEPEVLMDGDHDIARCEAVTLHVLKVVFDELFDLRVALEGMILKPNMIVAGRGGGRAPAPPEQVAERTVAVLKASVPSAVPGVAFLSERPVRRGGDGQPRRDQPGRRNALAGDLLLRPRPAARRAKGVGRAVRQRRRRPGRLRPPRPHEQPGGGRSLGGWSGARGLSLRAARPIKSPYPSRHPAPLGRPPAGPGERPSSDVAPASPAPRGRIGFGHARRAGARRVLLDAELGCAPMSRHADPHELNSDGYP